MKRQITAQITYPNTMTEHIAQFNKQEFRKRLFYDEISLSGYLVDSETLPIGTPIYIDLKLFSIDGLLESNTRIFSEYGFKILFEDKFYNWFERLTAIRETDK